jgi:hypothetical protein
MLLRLTPLLATRRASDRHLNNQKEICVCVPPADLSPEPENLLVLPLIRSHHLSGAVCSVPLPPSWCPLLVLADGNSTSINFYIHR